MKTVFVQIGPDMEEAARVAGAGWVKTYFRIWLPLLMPTLALLAVLNFTSAAGTTAPIILLASRETMTLSLLALEFASPGINNREAASIISIFIIGITIAGALIVRNLGLRLSVRHDMSAGVSPHATTGTSSGMQRINET
jgi:iron(III) transport system permease protein